MRLTAVFAGVLVATILSIAQTGHAAAPSRAATALERSLGAQGVVEVDPAIGTPRVVARLDAPLTSPSRDRPDEVVRTYLREHRDVFGLGEAEISNLEIVRRFGARGTLVHLTYALTHRGVPVAGAGLRAAVSGDGELISLSGEILPDVRVDSVEPALSSAESLRIARRASKTPPAASSADATPRFPGGGPTRLVIEADRGGRGTLAWRVLTREADGQTFDTTVDATTGAVLSRRPLSLEVAARVFDHYPGAPRGGSQRAVDLAPYKFTDERRGRYGLFGPNAFVFADVDDDEAFEERELIPPSNEAGDYDYPYQPFDVPGGNCPPAPYRCSWDHTIPFSWSANVDQRATQLFWFLNRFHDHLLAAPIEFTRAKGNFETADGDPIWGTVDVGAALADGLPDDPGEELGHVNNAYYSYAPDGSIALIAALLFKPTFLDPGKPTVSSADDAATMYHEYAHGLSTRLVTDAQGVHGLTEPQPRAVGEALSDWYALDYLEGQNLITDEAGPGDVGMGRYVNGMRSQPIDCPVGAGAARCPQDPDGSSGPGGFTLGDLGRVIDRPEPHADGEILAQTLWDLRRRLIGELGRERGIARTRLLVTAGLELTPVEPTLLDFRNAMLLADMAYLRGLHRDDLWSVFAARGMGHFASTVDSGDARPVESFALPPAGSPGAIAGVVTGDRGGPLAGVPVRIPGAGGGVGRELKATTDAQGRYLLTGVPPGTYPQVVAGPHRGFDRELALGVAVTSGATAERDLRLTRNWAAAGGGGEVVAVSHEFASADCGAAKLVIDQSFGTGWNTHSPAYHRARGPKSLTIRLPEAVDIEALAIDPAVPCGPGASAGLGQYRIETSVDGQAFDVAAEGAFTRADGWRRNVVSLRAGTTARRRYVRLTGLSTVDSQPGRSGRVYMGFTELQVYGRPAALTVTPVATPTPSPTPSPTPAPGSGTAGPDRVAPVISGLRARPATFAAPRARRGSRAPGRITTFQFVLSEAATVTADFHRCIGDSRRCRRSRLGGRFRAPGRQGANRVPFSGHVRAGGREIRLTAGRYRVTFVARDAAGNRSKPRTISVRAVRR